MGKIADLTYQGIRDRILSGEYRPGAHFKRKAGRIYSQPECLCDVVIARRRGRNLHLHSLLEGQAAFRAAAVRL
jgi:hypothetical protein